MGIDPHRPARRDTADDLVTEDDRQTRRRGAALDLIQLGVADAADRHAHEDFARTGARIGELVKG